MNKTNNRTYRFETLHHNRDSALSLSPLSTMLTQAQKDLPPQVLLPPEDASDELALKLIAGVRRQFKRSHPAHWIGSALRLDFRKMAETDVR